MEQKKHYVIKEKIYKVYIDKEVYLCSLLYQFVFLAGKIKSH